MRAISTPSTRSSPRIATGEARKRSRTVRGFPDGFRVAKSRRISTLRWTTLDAVSSSAALAGSSSSSAGSTTTSAPAMSPSSPSSVDVHEACTGPRRPRTTISRMPDETIASIAASVVSVGASSSSVSASMRATSSATFPFPIDDDALVREVELEVLVVRVAVVPGDELGGRPRARQVLAGDAEPPVGLGADRVDDGVVERGELLVRDVAADLDVAEEAESRARGDLLEGTRDGLELGVVGSDAEPDEPPRRRQPLDHVDLDRRILAREQRGRRVERGRAGADDGDAQRSAHAADPSEGRC